MTPKPIKGFSKLSKEAKMEWIANEYLGGDDRCIGLLKSYWHEDKNVQKIHDEFIENTITNFYIPFGIAPNFLINNRVFCIPMAIEESSVVAAAAKNETGLLIFGLLLSVLLVGTVATFFANYIKNHKWVGVLGLVVILFVAVQLILGGTNEIYPGTIPEFILKFT